MLTWLSNIKNRIFVIVGTIITTVLGFIVYNFYAFPSSKHHSQEKKKKSYQDRKSKQFVSPIVKHEKTDSKKTQLIQENGDTRRNALDVNKIETNKPADESLQQKNEDLEKQKEAAEIVEEIQQVLESISNKQDVKQEDSTQQVKSDESDSPPILDVKLENVEKMDEYFVLKDSTISPISRSDSTSPIQKPLEVDIHQIVIPSHFETKETLKLTESALKELEEKKQRRKHIISEFVSTERSYIQHLKILKQKYLDPAKSIISKESMKKIFGDVEWIIRINTSFLEDVEEALKSQNQDLAFAQVLKKDFPMFKLYTKYISNYSLSQEAIKKECKKNKKFEQFLNRVQQELEKENCRMIDLNSYLITPIQRIARYKLLLEDLLKNTDKQEGLVCKVLEEACETIRNVVEFCNTKERDFHNMIRMYQLQAELKIKNLCTTTRKFILETNTIRIVRSNGKLGSCKLYLFSDLLICHRKKLMSAKIVQIPLLPRKTKTGRLQGDSLQKSINKQYRF